MSQTDRRTGLVGYSGMKVPVHVAATVAITLSGEQTVNGVACVTGDRVLVTAQASSVDNGIYVVDTGDWNRAADCDGPYDLVQGSLIYAYAGTASGNKIWKCTSADDIDIGTDALTFQVVDIEVTGIPQILWCATAAGTANALVLTPTTAATALATGLTLMFKTGISANSGAVTIAVSGLSAAAAQINGAAMVAGDLEASQWYMATFDGTNFQVQKIGIPNLVHGQTNDGFEILGGNISITGILTPSQLTASQNDFAPAGITGNAVVRLSSNSAVNITGFNITANGRVLVHENVGNQPITLASENTSSVAANRITASANVVLAENDVAITLYDPTTARHRVAAQPPNGAYRSVQVFTGNGTWTKPTGVKRVKVTVIGGGGGGGGAANNATTAAGGGAGGGYAIKTIPVASLGTTETVTVGTAGTAGAASGGTGGTGGTSSFGSHCSATGGEGGVGAAAGSVTIGGARGSGSGGDINGTGGDGNWGQLANPHGGGGGNSIMGGGGRGRAGNSGIAGGAYGGGGAGGSASGGGDNAGGAGAAGIVIVEEFF